MTAALGELYDVADRHRDRSRPAAAAVHDLASKRTRPANSPPSFGQSSARITSPERTVTR